MNTLESKKQNLFLRLFKGNPLTILIAVAIYGVTAAMVYSGSAPRQFTNMIIAVSCDIVMAVRLNLVVGFLGRTVPGTRWIYVCRTSLRLPCVNFPGRGAAHGGAYAGVHDNRRHRRRRLRARLWDFLRSGLKATIPAIVTLACGEIIKSVITNLKFTGGALGLNTSEVYSSAKELLPFAVILVFCHHACGRRISRSRSRGAP